MLRSTQLTRASVARPRALPVDRIWRRSSSVHVVVVDWGLEVDGFSASSCDALRAQLAPIYKHLPGTGAAVHFAGIEERWLPLGIRRVHREVSLSDLGAALAFLGR